MVNSEENVDEEFKKLRGQIVEVLQLLDGYQKIMASYILENGPMIVSKSKIVELPNNFEIGSEDIDGGYAFRISIIVPD